VYEDQQLTYRELNSRANQLAHYLQELGVKPDTLVGICLERSLEMVIGLLAILKAGGAYIPLDPNYPPERLSYMLDNSGMKLLLTQQNLLSSLSLSNTQIVCLDRDCQAIEQRSQCNPDTEVNSDNLIYVIYTSGSTGRAKGAGVFHRGFTNLLSWYVKEFNLEEIKRVLLTTSFNFDLTQKNIYAPLIGGGTLHISPSSLYDPQKIIRQIDKYEIAWLNCTPSMFSNLLETLDQEYFYKLSSLRYVFLGGEPIQVAAIINWLQSSECKATIVNTYGPTECTDVCAFYSLNQPEEFLNKSVPIGQSLPNVQLMILDPNHNLMPIGIIGELCIAGTGVGAGYINNRERTVKQFIVNPFGEGFIYKTGDFARYLPDGNIEFLGRMDNQVKIRGFRIELGEIEAVLSNCPQAQQAVVIVREEIKDSKRLIAYIVAADESVNSHRLREYVKQYLPEYMVPSNFVFLKAFPLTPNGKVDRKALLSLEFNSLREQQTSNAPRNSLEVTLLQIWTEILETENLGVEDNFFEFGGHSLLAVRLLNQVEKHFNRKLSLAAFFQEPTIEGLAKLLSQTSDQIGPVTLVPLQPKGDKSPFYCVHAIGGSVACYWQLSRCLKPERPFYGLQSPQLSDSEMSFSSLEEMAQFYLDEIIARQPQGPYYLGGWSFGGLIAYEMARQLQARKQEVASLILLDTFAPVLSSTVLDLDSSQLMAFFATHLGGSLKPNDYLSHEKLRQIPAQEQLEYVFAWAVQHHLLPENLDSWQFKQLFLVFKNNLQLARHYRSLPYTGKIELFLAKEQVELSLDWLQYSGTLDHELSILLTKSDRGWSEVIGDTGKIATYPISGNHYTMLQSPHIDNVAAKIDNLWNM
jgi:amino acid adenylation domain-containing protein